MRRERLFYPVAFDPSITRQAYEVYIGLQGNKGFSGEATVFHDDGSVWAYDELEEFFADYRKFPKNVHLLDLRGGGTFQFSTEGPRCRLRVQLKNRAQIEQVFRVFEDAEKDSVVEPRVAPKVTPRIFIGHGRDMQWKMLKDHLHDQHGYEVVAYESGARAGHTIRDILDEMMAKSSFAFLVFTGEDQLADGMMRARQNVVHETGLFQGTLGFSKAIILIEDGVENLSNLDGVQYIRFTKGNIREAFGDSVATIRREFYE